LQAEASCTTVWNTVSTRKVARYRFRINLAQGRENRAATLSHSVICFSRPEQPGTLCHLPVACDRGDDDQSRQRTAVRLQRGAAGAWRHERHGFVRCRRGISRNGSAGPAAKCGYRLKPTAPARPRGPSVDERRSRQQLLQPSGGSSAEIAGPKQRHHGCTAGSSARSEPDPWRP